MFLIIVCEWMRNGTFCLQAMVDEEAMDPMLHLLDVCQRSVCRQAEPLAKRPAVEVLRFCWKKNSKVSEQRHVLHAGYRRCGGCGSGSAFVGCISMTRL
jgi:hypothetical protein